MAVPTLINEPIAGIEEHVAHAIQDWVFKQIETQLGPRLEIAGMAIQHTQTLEAKKQEILAELELQAGRTSTLVGQANAQNTKLEATFSNLKTETEQMMSTLEASFAAMQDQIASATASTEALGANASAAFESNKADVTALHEKTRVFADNSVASINLALKQTSDLREEVRIWSHSYGEEVRQMVTREMRSGKADHGDGPAAAGSKLDKKEVSVWKLQDSVSKLDFRHWLDAIDLQLEAIHGFSYPDLVLEKVKRYPTEITETALKEIIQKINDEQAAKKRRESGKD